MTHTTRNGSARTVIAAVVVCVIVIAVGSIVYWIADGRGGTPADFRRRVAATGLDVEWSNSGPRGGSGTVLTDCDTAEVTIDDINGVLWVRWDEHRRPVDAETIEALRTCGP